MAKHVTELLEDALALPEEARAALAGSLLESLDTTVDEDAEARWREEIDRRVQEIDTGSAATVSWTETEADLRRKIKRG